MLTISMKQCKTKIEKELDKLIEATYYKHGNGVQIPIMSIPKIFAAAIEASIHASIATYRVN